jgi:diguanylate cyclase (GGDEF)-like protein
LNIQNHSMYTDHLTGVNNRKKLDAYLKEKVSLSTGEKGFSAILIDINNFKYINDTYGHDIGDNALETVAKLLKSCIRTNDFIARFGGDEFCIVLDISNISDLEAMVCRINNCLEKYNKSGTHLYELGFSMGYAVYAYHLHKSAEEFLKQVDILMYESKQAYKNKLSM